MEGETIGFWVAVSGQVTAVGVGVLHYLDYRFKQSESNREAHKYAEESQVAYLQRQINDLKRQNEVCESRCEELREHVLELMAQQAPKRKRQKVDRQT